MGQIQLTTSIILIGLFSFAIIGFAINFAQDNSSAVNIANDTQINELYTGINSNLSSFGDESESQYKSIIQSTTKEGSSITASSGPFAITPIGAMSLFKNILKTGYIKIFGSGAGFGVFFTSFISLLVFMFGLYIIKTWRGNPD